MVSWSKCNHSMNSIPVYIYGRGGGGSGGTFEEGGYMHDLQIYLRLGPEISVN